MADSAETVGQLLKRVAITRRVSQRALARRYAERFGVSEESGRSTVGNWFRDEHEPNEEGRLFLMDELGLSADDLAQAMRVRQTVIQDLTRKLASLEERLRRLEDREPQNPTSSPRSRR